MRAAVRSRVVLAMQKVEGSSPFIRIGSMPFPGISRLRRGPTVSQNLLGRVVINGPWARVELDAITRRRILYWLAVMVAVLVVGTIIGLIWADTSNVAGSIAVASNIVGPLGIVGPLVALGVVSRRHGS